MLKYRFDAVQQVAYVFDDAEWDESQHPRDEAGRFSESDEEADPPGDPSTIDESGDYTEDLDKVYWRLQNEGYSLSQTHMSESWGEDEGHKEPGTSAVEHIGQLQGVGANVGPIVGQAPMHVEVLGFTAASVNGKGSDREPVVTPEKELVRFRSPSTVKRLPDALGQLKGVRKLADFERLGWTRVETRAVQ